MSKEPLTTLDKVAYTVFWTFITATVVMGAGNLLSIWTLSWWVVFAPVLAIVALLVGCVAILFLGFGYAAWQISRGNG